MSFLCFSIKLLCCRFLILYYIFIYYADNNSIKYSRKKYMRQTRIQNIYYNITLLSLIKFYVIIIPELYTIIYRIHVVGSYDDNTLY